MNWITKLRLIWAISKAKELGYNKEEISLGKTHASFVRIKKSKNFYGEELKGVQIKYPNLVNLIFNYIKQGKKEDEI